ncbi:MAG: PhnD/SsuA/transferrin family substrate-binding protein [Pararhodobacter sp.]|nr:PhnD/SsuA/transferrin family substrate-binding protein [Pararhodobacter sp.]
MSMLACLPMYDWPEVRARVDAFYGELRARSKLDLPEALTRPADEDALFTLWRDPTLVLGQACWGPISLGMLPGLRVLAQQDYSDVPGGDGPLFRSVLVVRRGVGAQGRTTAPANPATPPVGQGCILPDRPLAGKRLAFNARHSLSGWIALARDLDTDPAAQAAGLIESGSHRASIRAVAEATADIAAIDCRAWALALQHEPCARDLTVIGWSSARPGLPFITGAGIDERTAARLQETLIGMGCHPPGEEFS